MAGIYIHIPFCKQACHYCNFHFSTNLQLKEKMVAAINQEILLRSSYLSTKNLTSIYFGGGTPSILQVEELDSIFNTLAKEYTWSEEIEITLEANPDDLTTEKIAALASTDINRLSIGVQSFFEEDLVFMNRAHSSEEAHKAIERAQQHHFDITVDLIYGSPTTSMERWKSNLEKVIAMELPHISSYCLTVEEKTALHHFVQKGKVQPVDEQKANEQFELMVSMLQEAGYEHYEISNFSRPGKNAVHNSNYWKGKPYLGLGPGAHSFDGKSKRHWNVSNNPKYISSVEANTPFFTEEILTIEDQYNEYVLTKLRTKWGVTEEHVETHFQAHLTHFQHQLKTLQNQGFLVQNDAVFTLSHKGKLMADWVSSELFVV